MSLSIPSSQKSAFFSCLNTSEALPKKDQILVKAFQLVIPTFESGDLPNVSASLKEKYQITEISTFLGKGGFGSVVLAKKGVTNVALKIISPYRDQKKIDIEEENCLKLDRLNSMHTLKCFGQIALERPCLKGLIFEAGGPNLYQKYLRPDVKKKITYQEIVFFLIQSFQFLEVLEKNEIVVRDMKPDNALVCGDLSQPGSLRFIDFAYMGTEGEKARKFYQGTRNYRSPQFLLQKYGKSETRVAIGCIFFELLTSKLLFETEFCKESIDNKILRQLNCFFTVADYPGEKFLSEIDPVLYMQFFDYKGLLKRNFKLDKCFEPGKDRKLFVKEEIRKALDGFKGSSLPKKNKDILTEQIFDLLMMLLDYQEPKSLDALRESSFFQGHEQDLENHRLSLYIETDLAKLFSQLSISSTSDN